MSFFNVVRRLQLSIQFCMISITTYDIFPTWSFKTFHCWTMYPIFMKIIYRIKICWTIRRIVSLNIFVAFCRMKFLTRFIILFKEGDWQWIMHSTGLKWCLFAILFSAEMSLRDIFHFKRLSRVWMLSTLSFKSANMNWNVNLTLSCLWKEHF